MSEAPASPRAARLAAPGWLDTRLVIGVLLVLVSVVLGARLAASADRSQGVWVAAHDLAAGSTLGTGDLRSARVTLSGSGAHYLLAQGAEPVGYVLQRGIATGELLPEAALARPGSDGRPSRDVSVPVTAGHLPDDLRAGQQVDVYVTPGQSSGQSSGRSPAPTPGATQDAGPTATRLVLSGLPVTLRPRSGGLTSGGTAGVVLSVPEADAATLVAAVQEGRLDLVRVPGREGLRELGPAAG